MFVLVLSFTHVNESGKELVSVGFSGLVHYMCRQIVNDSLIWTVELKHTKSEKDNYFNLEGVYCFLYLLSLFKCIMHQSSYNSNDDWSVCWVHKGPDLLSK